MGRGGDSSEEKQEVSPLYQSGPAPVFLWFTTGQNDLSAHFAPVGKSPSVDPTTNGLLISRSLFLFSLFYVKNKLMLRQIAKKVVPAFLIGWYHYILAFGGALIYCFPSRKLKVIGVTGTNGKSTTVMMICRILEEAGYKVGSVSSIWFKVGQQEKPNPLHMTMPGRFWLQKLMRQMLKNGCRYAVLELTSEGVLQHRHKFIHLDSVVFTNLSAEHIERHGGFENYRAAKGEYFKACKKTHIINMDDGNTDYFLRFFAEEKYLYKIKNQNAKCRMVNQNAKIIEANNVQGQAGSLKFDVNGVSFVVSLLGGFNVYNSLAAICVGMSQGVSLETAKKALEKIQGVPGRMEVVQAEPFLVLVDLAHTPPAVEKVYQACRSLLGAGAKMITVFGAAGGGRDKQKRPELGRLAARYCDIIILTNEDPYDENAPDIIEEIRKGIFAIQNPKSKIGDVYQILDRKEAIKKALAMANPGDVVLLLGKGTEATMVFAGGRKIAWDERQVVREQLQALKSGK